MNRKACGAALAACIAVATIAAVATHARGSQPEPSVGSARLVSAESLVASAASTAPEREPVPQQRPPALEQSEPTPLLVRATIVDADGSPVSGAQISVGPTRTPSTWPARALGSRMGAPARIAQGESASDGVCELRVEPAADLVVAVRAPGRAPLDLVVGIAGRTELDVGRLVLVRGARLAGRVVDDTGRPVAGAEILRQGTTTLSDVVQLDWTDTLLATSTDDGTFAIDELAFGRTTLEVRAPGFVRLRRDFFADGERPEWHVELARAAPITGRVVGAAPGSELEVSFWLQDLVEQRTVRCASDGSFVIDDLPPDGPELDLVAVGPAVTRGLGGREALSRSVRARPGARDVELVVPPATTYRMQVVDAVTREPLDDVHVGLLESMDFESGRTCSFERTGPGAYALAIVLPQVDKGTAVAVSHAGHQGIALAAQVEPGSTRDFGVVALEPLEATVLRVVDAASGAAIANAKLIAALEAREGDDCFYAHVRSEWAERSDRNAGWSGVTASDGTATAHLSRRQRYWVSASAAEHAPGGTWIDVGESAPREIELTLGRGGTVALRLLDAEALMPLAGGAIEWENVGDGEWGPRERIHTDAQGHARLEHIAPGRHLFWPSHSDRRNAQVADVVEAGTAELTLLQRVERKVRLHGRITEHGVPVVGAMVACAYRETATDLDGRYAFEGLAPEERELEITHPRLGPVASRTVLLLAPETRVDVDLAPQIVAGSVRDEGGAPLAGAAVWIGERYADGTTRALYSESARAALHTTTTGADGRFRFEGVQPRDGLWLVCQRAGSCAARIGPLAFPPEGSALELAPVLRRAAELEVVVEGLDPQSFLLGQVVARWRGTEELAPEDREQKGEGVKNTLQSTSLRFRFDTLPPGAWRIEVRDFFALDEGEPRAAADVELHAGANERLVLRP